MRLVAHLDIKTRQARVSTHRALIDHGQLIVLHDLTQHVLGEVVCLTLVHALVLARSAFEHSANYDSAMVFGTFSLVDDEAERLGAFEAFTEKLLPGRWDEARQPNAKELKATSILGLEVDEASAKVRSGGPDDDGSKDAELDIWAGVLPIVSSYGAPTPSHGLREGIPVPESVKRLLRAPPG